MTYPITTQRRAEAQAELDYGQRAIRELESRLEQMRPKLEQLKEMHGRPESGNQFAESLAVIRNAVRSAESGIESAKKHVSNTLADIKGFDQMLNADAELEDAKAAWQEASAAQVRLTRDAQEARKRLQALEAALDGELNRINEAQAAQRAATLADLGFGDKPDGAHAAAAAKALQQAQIKADALREAVDQAQALIDHADLALIAADQRTRQTEGLILVAKLHQAQRDHLESNAVYLQALAQLHGAEAAIGAVGPRIRIYADDTHDQRNEFARIAENLKAMAEQGE